MDGHRRIWPLEASVVTTLAAPLLLVSCGRHESVAVSTLTTLMGPFAFKANELLEIACVWFHVWHFA
jgi:hypothetical protein